MKVRLINALTFAVTTRHNRYNISLLEQKYDKKTAIELAYETNWLNALLPAQTEKWLEKTRLYNFKNYLESPSEYYGLNFKKAFIAEKHMIVYKTVIKPKDIFKGINKGAALILHRVKAREMADTTKIFIQTTPEAGGVGLFVGVNVKKQPKQNYPGLNYMYLYGMQSLIIDYNGIYKDKNKIRGNIDNYLHDHGQKYLMQPIEIYKRNHLPMSDTSLINIQIVAPVK